MTLPSQLKEGSRVTCEDGHLIAVTNTTLNKSKGWSVSWFDWRIPSPPKDGEPFTNCPTCNKLYARVHAATGRNQICVDKEWWPRI